MTSGSPAGRLKAGLDELHDERGLTFVQFRGRVDAFDPHEAGQIDVLDAVARGDLLESAHWGRVERERELRDEEIHANDLVLVTDSCTKHLWLIRDRRPER